MGRAGYRPVAQSGGRHRLFRLHARLPPTGYFKSIDRWWRRPTDDDDGDDAESEDEGGGDDKAAAGDDGTRGGGPGKDDSAAGRHRATNVIMVAAAGSGAGTASVGTHGAGEGLEMAAVTSPSARSTVMSVSPLYASGSSTTKAAAPTTRKRSKFAAKEDQNRCGPVDCYYPCSHTNRWKLFNIHRKCDCIWAIAVIVVYAAVVIAIMGAPPRKIPFG